MRQLTAWHSAFDRQLKQPVNIPTPLAHNQQLSHFAFELVRKEYNKGCVRDPDPDFTSPCACSFATTYRLPCRHFFATRLSQNADLYDATLIDNRWMPPAASVPLSSHHYGNTSQMSFQATGRTPQERFKLAMSRCSVIASLVVDAMRCWRFAKKDRAKLVEIRQHWSFTAWNRLQSAIAGFSTDDTVCHDFKRRSGEGRQNTIKWVQCDACVHWLHLNCVGLSRQPRGNWFCSACDA